MTKAEAIAMLKRIQEPEAWEPQINQAAFEALDMAIKALSQESSEDLISRQAAIDALWKALYEYEDKTEKQFQESEDLDVGDWIEHRIFVQNMNDIDRQTILNLPSAQPEPKWIPVSERLPDRDGKYLVVGRQKAINILKFDGGRWYGKWGVIAWLPLPEPYREGEPMSDSISRQAAIDAINTWDKFGVDERGRLVRWHEGLELYVHLRDVLTAIVNLPPAQQERKGKWIKEHEEWFTDYPYKCTNCGKYSRARYHFCPNCGADMRGEQDDD